MKPIDRREVLAGAGALSCLACSYARQAAATSRGAGCLLASAANGEEDKDDIREIQALLRPSADRVVEFDVDDLCKSLAVNPKRDFRCSARV